MLGTALLSLGLVVRTIPARGAQQTALRRSTCIRAAAAIELTFEPPSVKGSATTVIVGTRDALCSDGARQLLPVGFSAELWDPLVESCKPGDAGDEARTIYAGVDGAATLVAAVLPSKVSRHNSPLRPDALTNLVGAACAGAGDPRGAQVIAVLDDASMAAPAALAIARAFPLFSRKTSSPSDEGEAEGEEAAASPSCRVSFATPDGPLLADRVYRVSTIAATGVRTAQRIVDTPPEEMGTLRFVTEAVETAARLEEEGHRIKVEVTSGQTLEEKGFGGLWNVGKAATQPPAFVLLSYLPDDAEREGVGRRAVGLVGKGIVYDTGGLALKPREGMCGMKGDCGGAAALLAGFEAAVSIGTRGVAVHLALCLAENAIGPGAVRHDDIIQCFSGKTVEINNSDAEGRLVLADGVAYVTAVPSELPNKERLDLVVDMATLTGAQMVATGKKHAGIVANADEIEAAAVAAGLRSGDLVHPLPFAPEFYRAEFKSEVADMKNSVKDRGNAQASCAANFVHEHLHPEFSGDWLHVDLAGPAWGSRATGYGVGLTLALLSVEGFD